MKSNTVTFTCADGRKEKLPLKLLVDRGAVIADKVNGDDVSMVMGGANQLWVPGLPAKYFLRDIVKIEFSNEPDEPSLPDFVDDGHDYSNRPNVSAKCAPRGRMGEEMLFEGWADDYDKSIVGIEFSLDGGDSWSFYGTPGSSAGRVTTWSFSWVPEDAGVHVMKVRSVNEDGDRSPVAAVCVFEIEA